jgi:hypothetical protein
VVIRLTNCSRKSTFIGPAGPLAPAVLLGFFFFSLKVFFLGSVGPPRSFRNSNPLDALGKPSG